MARPRIDPLLLTYSELPGSRTLHDAAPLKGSRLERKDDEQVDELIAARAN